MGRLLIRLGIGLLFALFGFINYWSTVAVNPVTGEKQRVQLSAQQEIVLGQRSIEDVAGKYGGLYPDEALQNYVNRVGDRVVQQSIAAKSPYRDHFDFYLLRDPRTINAFALPGGQICITYALFSRLNSEAQLAGVFGHEVGHVIGRHGAEHLAKEQLGAALVNAVGIAASETMQGAQNAQILAQTVKQMLDLRYGREDELESDRLGFKFMTQAGYNPQGIVELMRILNSAKSGNEPPEFFSTHPNPGNRIGQLQGLIAQAYPNGIPAKLEQGKQKFAQQVAPRLQPSNFGGFR